MKRSKLFLPICMTVLLSAVLYRLASTGNPVWHVTLFQDTALIFLVVTLFRHLPRPRHAAVVAPNCSEPESKSPVGLLVALVAGALTYSGTVPFFFICDDFDHLNLIRHPFMQSMWPQITKGQLDGSTFIFYRPLGFLSLFLDYRLWHNWAAGYHLTNLLLHLLCVAGLYFLCKQLGLRNESCTVAALVFAVLPVNVQAVTWIACRFDQMATTLGVWSVAFAARFRRTRQLTCYCVALLCMVLAIMSKESAYVIPVSLLALELIPVKEPTSRRSLAQRFGPLLGYAAFVLALLLHRFRTFGGLGGYRIFDGKVIAKSDPLVSVAGIFLRAPGGTLFGYNWFQPHNWTLALAAGATAAVFLTLCLLAEISVFSSRIVWFSLLWVFVAAVPVHFYLWDPDPGLTYSRALYLGSIGASILVGLLFGQTFRGRRVSFAWTLALTVFLFVGVQHNLKAWRFVSGVSRAVLAHLDQKVPDPPPSAIFYINGTPDAEYGVPFFHVGLENAVRFNYSWRTDIHVNPQDTSELDARSPVFVFSFR